MAESSTQSASHDEQDLVMFGRRLTPTQEDLDIERSPRTSRDSPASSSDSPAASSDSPASSSDSPAAARDSPSPSSDT